MSGIPRFIYIYSVTRWTWYEHWSYSTWKWQNRSVCVPESRMYFSLQFWSWINLNQPSFPIFSFSSCHSACKQSSQQHPSITMVVAVNFLDSQADTHTRIWTQKEHISYLRFQSKHQLSTTIQLLESALWSVLKAVGEKSVSLFGFGFRWCYTPWFIQVQFIIGNPGEEGYNNKL